METKERILQRTGELLQVMGVKSLTMDFIAVDLGISKRTIYELFTDKDELVLQAVDYYVRLNNQKLLQIVNQTVNVIEAIFVIIDHQHRQMASYHPLILEDLKKYFIRLSAMYYENREKCREFSASYTLLEKGKKEGMFRSELKIDVVDSFIFELMNMFHNRSKDMIQLSRKDILENIFLPYFRGLCTMKGQELIDMYLSKIETINNI